MILGVPLAVIMKILLESDERTLPIAIMLSRNPPSPVDDGNEDPSLENERRCLCDIMEPPVESLRLSPFRPHFPPITVTESQFSKAKTENSEPIGTSTRVCPV